MNILMVLSTQTYPPDRRVEREARDLIRDGHNLFLMARRRPEQPPEEVVDGVHVMRVPLPFQHKRAIADLIYYGFQRYSILLPILRACRKHRIDALHVHDLPYAFSTALASRLLRIPFIFDMHEHYTVMLRMGFEAKAYRKFKPLAFILLSLLRIEERIACRSASKVIVVADEHVGRIHALGVSPKNILVVTNTEDVDYFTGLPIDQALVEAYRDDFVILYVGAFNPHRGLDTAIRAMPAVLEKVPNARLLLVGDGIDRLEKEQLARALGLTERITFVGFQPFELLPTYIELSDVCLIPHISTPHIETTMPNKIFQFMILGKPVVVSNTRPLMRVVQDAECGLVFQERDARSLAEVIIELNNEDLRRRLGENGRRAVEDRYNWQETVQTLLRTYNPPRHDAGSTR